MIDLHTKECILSFLGKIHEVSFFFVSCWWNCMHEASQHIWNTTTLNFKLILPVVKCESWISIHLFQLFPTAKIQKYLFPWLASNSNEYYPVWIKTPLRYYPSYKKCIMREKNINGLIFNTLLNKRGSSFFFTWI